MTDRKPTTNDSGIPDRIYGKHGTMELGGDRFAA